MSALSIYLFTRVDTIRGMLLLMIITLICSIVFKSIQIFVEADEIEEFSKYMKKYFKKYIFILIGLILPLILIPSQRDLIYIYTIPKLADNATITEISKMPKQLLSLINTKIEEQLSIENKQQ